MAFLLKQQKKRALKAKPESSGESVKREFFDALALRKGGGT